MRRLFLSFFVLACAGTLFAVEIVPPLVDSHTYVKLRVDADCVPAAHAEVVGSTINVTVAPVPGFVCAALAPPAIATANVGVLAPGVYDIEPSHQQLIVRDADSGVLVTPVGIAAGAKTKTVQIYSADRPFSAVSEVLFDGVPATVVQNGFNPLVVMPPPHAPGTVDVTVTDHLATRKAVAAFTYFDPAAPPDPQIFEPVLYPIAYNGGGLFESQWTTENTVGTGRTLVRFRDPVQVNYCDGGTCSQTDWSAGLAAQSQAGVLLWVVRRRLPAGVDDEFRAASRVADVSRTRSAGTSLPVAREKDFRSSVTLAEVPLSRSGDRIQMRVYSLDAPAAFVRLAAQGGSETDVRIDLPALNEVHLGTLDLTTSLPSSAQRATVTVDAPSLGSKVWAMVTITNNQTQEVTAIWPQ